MSITIREALQLPDMVQTKLIAGAGGLDHPIRWVTIVEVLEDPSRLQEGEFLITTGFGLDGDSKRLASFIPSLARQKLSGVAIHTGFYLREIPQEFIQQADLYRLPLIEIPVEINFSTITKAILQPIVNRQFETLAYSQAIHNQMIEAALSKGGLSAIIEELAKLTGGAVTLVDALGFEVVQHGPRTSERTGEEKESAHAVSIRASREHFGSLTLSKPKHLWKELDDVALQHAATLCALEYVKERAVSATEWRLKGDFVEELLSGKEMNEAELESRCRMLGYPLQGRHLVAAVRVNGNDRDSSELHQNAITLMRRLCDRQKRSYLLRERPHCLFFCPAGRADKPAAFAAIGFPLGTALSRPGDAYRGEQSLRSASPRRQSGRRSHVCAASVSVSRCSPRLSALQRDARLPVSLPLSSQPRESDGIVAAFARPIDPLRYQTQHAAAGDPGRLSTPQWQRAADIPGFVHSPAYAQIPDYPD